MPASTSAQSRGRVSLALGRPRLEHVETEAVVVHDAARPLVAAILVDGVLGRLDGDRDAAAVIAATPVMDTIKEASVSRRVLRTERSRCGPCRPSGVLGRGLRQRHGPPDDLGGSPTTRC